LPMPNSFESASVSNRSAHRVVVGTFSLKIAGAALSTALAVLMARLLGPVEYGTFSHLLALAGVAQIIISGGVPTLLLRAVASIRDNGGASSIVGLYRRGALLMWTGMIPGGLFAVLLLRTLDRPGISGALLATLVGIVACSSQLSLVASALRGMEMTLRSQLPELILRPLASVLLLLGYYGLGDGPIGHPASLQLHLVAILGALLAARLTLKSGLSLHSASVHSQPVIQPDWGRAAMWLTLLELVNLLSAKGDLILLGFLRPPGEAGLYQVAQQCNELIGFGVSSVAIALAPVLTRLHIAGERPQLQRLCVSVGRLSFGISALGATIVLIGGPELLAIVFGGDYVASFKPLSILVSGLLLSSVFGFPGLVLISLGFDRDAAKISFFTTFAGIVASFILIREIGLSGACYSFASGLVIRKYLLWKTLLSRTALNSAIYAAVRVTSR